MSAVDLGAPALLIAAAWVWVTYIRAETRLEAQRREHELAREAMRTRKGGA